MKKILFLNLSAALILSNNINAQDANPVKSQRQIFISEGYLGIGGYGNRGFENAENYFQDLAPNATYTPDGLKFQSDQNNFYYNGSGTFNLTLGFGFRDKGSNENVSNTTLRVGIVHSNSTIFDANWFNEERFPYDSLVSQQTGNKYPVDSVFSQNLDYHYNYKQLGLDVSLIFRSNSTPRFTIYGGIGSTVSMSYAAKTDVYYSERSSLSELEYFGSSYNSPYHYFDNDEERKHESFKNKTNHSLFVYVPLGIDFRFGNKNQFWKMVHIYYEMRPGMNFLFIPEIGNHSAATFSNNLGLRFRFNG